jgi:hypothetical protein
MLNGVMLNGVMLSVVGPSVKCYAESRIGIVMMYAVMLSAKFFTVLLRIIILSAIFRCVIMLRVALSL